MENTTHNATNDFTEQDLVRRKYNSLWENRFKDEIGPEPYLKVQPKPFVQWAFRLLALVIILAAIYTGLQ
jgi:hypothetical protein